MATIGERVTALEERAKARDIEMRDMKKTLSDMDHKLDVLIANDNRQKGAVGLGKFIAGTGIFGVIGMAALAVWNLIIGKGVS